MSNAVHAPVRQSVTVEAPLERAFAVFTEQQGAWWPPTHSILPGELADAVVEPREGGRWYERDATGAECDWGRVLAWEPPHRVVLSWQLNAEWQYDPDPARGSEIEIRFTEEGGATRVELEHRGFERHGAGAEQIASAVAGPGGWSEILDRYSGAVSA